KVFEDEYREDMTVEEAIVLGLKALHAATEGKFDVAMVEIGVVSNADPPFRKMTREEVAGYVERIEKPATPETTT
ncbi:MAG TPA: proteasome subunit alpha, partial [Methanoregulaceae archaeon]|nr:proteasome subunit alpha [Methanoregulaceae archaeon]